MPKATRSKGLMSAYRHVPKASFRKAPQRKGKR